MAVRTDLSGIDRLVRGNGGRKMEQIRMAGLHLHPKREGTRTVLKLVLEVMKIVSLF